jgi:hypothetical protein
MSCGIDQRVHPPPGVIGRVDQPLQIVIRLIRAGDADAAEFFRQRLALAGRGKDGDAEALCCHPPRRNGAHAGTAGGYDCYLLFAHRISWFAVLIGCRQSSPARLQLKQPLAPASNENF